MDEVRAHGELATDVATAARKLRSSGAITRTKLNDELGSESLSGRSERPCYPMRTGNPNCNQSAGPRAHDDGELTNKGHCLNHLNVDIELRTQACRLRTPTVSDSKMYRRIVIIFVGENLNKDTKPDFWAILLGLK